MDWVLELAENANTYTPLAAADERIVNDRFVLWMGRGDEPGGTSRSGSACGRTRSTRCGRRSTRSLRAQGRTACTWEVGSHATPADLVDRLLALGLVDDQPTPLAIGMVLDRAAGAGPPPDVEVRRAETRRGASRGRADRRGRLRAAGPDEPRPRDDDPNNVVYLAYVDGEPVARASGSFGEHGVTLFGGATLPEARGRGAYRALVAARWEDAVARGTPVLVTQAGPMSRPILARLGFREVCEIRILLDRVRPCATRQNGA